MAQNGVLVSHYGVTVKELKDLMQLRGSEAHETIRKKYGGVLELCNKLHTSPNTGKRFFKINMHFITLQLRCYFTYFINFSFKLYYFIA